MKWSSQQLTEQSNFKKFILVEKMNKYLYQFLYGYGDVWWDVTIQVYNQYIYKTNDPNLFKIVLPKSDYQRFKCFKGDPCFLSEKHVKVINNVTTEENIFIVSENIVLYTQEMIVGCKRYELDTSDVHFRYYHEIRPFLNMIHGDLDDELPEQLLSIKFITPDLKILEIGTNVGRNSLIISTLLENQQHLVSIECNKTSYQQEIANRNANHMNFHIKNVALSLKHVFQKGWNTITTEDDFYLEDWEKVNTTTFKDLESEFNITFDTLILDCEGAFYYIWKEFPSILDNIHLIIVENDYDSIDKYIEIRDQLYNQGFCCVYQEPLQSGMFHECHRFFYEVYSRI